MLAFIPLALAFPFAQSAWGTSPNGTLVFQGEPWIPFGVRIPANKEQIDQAKQAGIKDILLELPESGWEDVVRYAETSGLHYSLIFSQAAPTSSSYLVAPESFRYGPVTKPVALQTSIPGASSAIVVLATNRDGLIAQPNQDVQFVPMTSDSLQCQINPNSNNEATILAYPLINDLRLPSIGASMDLYRDSLVEKMKRVGPLSNLRAVFDPMGQLPKFPDANAFYVPTDPQFRLQLEVYLRQKYGTAERCVQAWEISASDITELSQLARMVPLFSERRGVSYLADPESKQTYRCDRRRTAAWKDIQFVTQSMLRSRYVNLVQTIRRHWDVPILQSWCGWNAPYSAPGSGLAGLGVRLEAAKFSSVLEETARAAAATSFPGSPKTLIRSDLELPASQDGMSSFVPALSESLGMGVRGWYFRCPNAEALNWVAAQAPAYSVSQVAALPVAKLIPFPEAAHNPAYPMKIGPNSWWVPGPGDGVRLDYGSQIAGYQYKFAGDSFYALWSTGTPQKLRLKYSDAQSITVEADDLSTPVLKRGKDFVEVNLGNTPILLRGSEDPPVIDQAITDSIAEFRALVATIPNNMRDYLVEINRAQLSIDNMKRDPVSNFRQLRSLIARLKMLLTNVNWIEAESSRRHNWSEVNKFSGASGEEALSLYTKILPPEGSFRATYGFLARNEGNCDVWAAVRGDATPLRIEVLGNVLSPEPNGYDTYSHGFRWYRFGTVNFGKKETTLSLSVPGIAPNQIDVDAVMIVPLGVRPNGPFVPFAQVLTPVGK